MDQITILAEIQMALELIFCQVSFRCCRKACIRSRDWLERMGFLPSLRVVCGVFFNCLQKFFHFLDALWKAELVKNWLLGNQFPSCYHKEAGLLPWSFSVLIQRE